MDQLKSLRHKAYPADVRMGGVLRLLQYHPLKYSFFPGIPPRKLLPLH